MHTFSYLYVLTDTEHSPYLLLYNGHLKIDLQHDVIRNNNTNVFLKQG